MKRKIIKIIGATIAVVGFLVIMGTIGKNDLAAEQGKAGLTATETLIRIFLGLLMFAAGSLQALTHQK